MKVLKINHFIILKVIHDAGQPLSYKDLRIRIDELSAEFKTLFGLNYSKRSLYSAIDILENARYVGSDMEYSPVKSKIIQTTLRGDRMIQLFNDFYRSLQVLEMEI